MAAAAALEKLSGWVNCALGKINFNALGLGVFWTWIDKISFPIKALVLQKILNDWVNIAALREPGRQGQKFLFG